MSKISYCSLEEAWGTQPLDKFNKDNQSSKMLMRDNYELINKKSEETRNNLITDMNLVERNEANDYDKYRITNGNSVKGAGISNNYGILKNSEGDIKNYNNNNSGEDIKKNNNNNSVLDRNSYTPFKEQIDKKYLENKLLYLENQLRQYKILIDKNSNSNFDSNFDSDNIIEGFSSSNNNESDQNKNFKSNDMVDLILLIIIGLLIIFVMNSVFSIGKSIGMRKKLE